ncbi:MAG: hypothetical protein E6J72_18845 [Deltaproteobacteria bacterium]|nr:MAG: hypothetical protein E6J72_18845 [Deltaproteobacteria bacterium]
MPTLVTQKRGAAIDTQPLRDHAGCRVEDAHQRMRLLHDVQQLCRDVHSSDFAILSPQRRADKQATPPRLSVE